MIVTITIPITCVIIYVIVQLYIVHNMYIIYIYMCVDSILRNLHVFHPDATQRRLGSSHSHHFLVTMLGAS